MRGNSFEQKCTFWRQVARGCDVTCLLISVHSTGKVKAEVKLFFESDANNQTSELEPLEKAVSTGKIHDLVVEPDSFTSDYLGETLGLGCEKLFPLLASSRFVDSDIVLT